MRTHGVKRQLDLDHQVDVSVEGLSGSTSRSDSKRTESAKRRRLNYGDSEKIDEASIPRSRQPATNPPLRSIPKPAKATIEPAALITNQPRTRSSTTGPVLSHRSIIEPTPNDLDVSAKAVGWLIRQIEQTVNTLKERGDKYKQQLRTALKQISDLRSKNAEDSRELQEARMRIEYLEAQKEKADSCLGGYKSHLKRSLQTSEQLLGDLKKAEIQTAYLERMLAFEEKSGFSTLVSEMQLH